MIEAILVLMKELKEEELKSLFTALNSKNRTYRSAVDQELDRIRKHYQPTSKKAKGKHAQLKTRLNFVRLSSEKTLAASSQADNHDPIEDYDHKKGSDHDHEFDDFTASQLVEVDEILNKLNA